MRAPCLFLLLLVGCQPGPTSTPSPLPSSPPAKVQVEEPHDDLTVFLARFGPPTYDQTTAYDNPRPPIPTRWLIYRAERVKALYVPGDARMGDPPPYNVWKLAGFSDLNDEPLEPEEVLRRMARRDRQHDR